jgi:hypothetical protein
MGPSLPPALLLLPLEAEEAREVLERLLLAVLVVFVDLRGGAVVPLFLVVVAIIW